MARSLLCAQWFDHSSSIKHVQLIGRVSCYESPILVDKGPVRFTGLSALSDKFFPRCFVVDVQNVRLPPRALKKLV